MLRAPEGLIFDTPTVPPISQITLITRIRSWTKGRRVNRDISLTTEAITIDDMTTLPSLNHATMIKTLKNLLYNGIKLAIEAQLTALQNMFNQSMEGKQDQRMEDLANIQAALRH